MEYTTFVINICNHRWNKYSKDTNYTRFFGCSGKNELDLDWVNSKYNFYWNCNNDLRFNVAGCSESHLRLMKKIIDEKLNKVIVIEDDAVIDFNRLDELKHIKEFCYIGGRLQAPTLKKKLPRENIDLFHGFNVIDTHEYIITGGHGYYFPTWEVCSEIYHNIIGRKKRRAIDVEFKRIQKDTKLNLIKLFLYPAISTLHLQDANNGFTFNEKRYKLNNNNFLY